ARRGRNSALRRDPSPPRLPLHRTGRAGRLSRARGAACPRWRRRGPGHRRPPRVGPCAPPAPGAPPPLGGVGGAPAPATSTAAGTGPRPRGPAGNALVGFAFACAVAAGAFL